MFMRFSDGKGCWPGTFPIHREDIRFQMSLTRAIATNHIAIEIAKASSRYFSLVVIVSAVGRRDLLANLSL